MSAESPVSDVPDGVLALALGLGVALLAAAGSGSATTGSTVVNALPETTVMVEPVSVVSSRTSSVCRA